MSQEGAKVPGARAWLLGPGPGLAVAIGLFAWLVYINRSSQVFEFDPDEGNNVIKALLVREGYSYGTEIWTDQPPLFSYLLVPAFAIFGTTMDVARGVVSAASAALVFGLYEALRRSVGHLGALTAAGLLVGSALYVPLSISVMIGLPSVTCLTLSALLALEAGRSGTRSRSARWTIAGAAGALAGAAVGIKLFAVPVVPVLLGTTLLHLRAGPRPDAGPTFVASAGRAVLRAASERGAAFVLGFVVLSFLSLAPLFMAESFSGLLETHQTAREQAKGSTDGFSTLSHFVADDALLFGLALLGTVVALVRRTWDALPWLGWLVLAAVALLDHSPIWPHHRLLLTVPAAALAGHAFCSDLRLLVHHPKVEQAYRYAVPCVALALVALSSSQKGRLEPMIEPVPWAAWTSSPADWKIFAEFSRYATHSNFVAAARPTFAFRAGRPVPPNLAVTSWKRFRVGLLSAKRVAKDVDETNPETVLFSSRWPGSVRAAVEKKIKKTHKRVKRWRHQSTDLWVSRELLNRMNEPEARKDHTDDTAPPGDRVPSSLE